MDVDSKIDTSKIDSNSLKTMDCITCHNRVSHSIPEPTEAIESAMSRGVISSDVPFIRQLAVKALTAGYESPDQASAGIAQALDSFYKTTYPDFYASEADKIAAAIAEVQRIYSVSVFKDQELDWNTHPDNIGHIDSPGCFRCHDGKHLNAANESVRLECNLCHSVPVVTAQDALVTTIEVTHGPEPESHSDANWISLHNQAYLTDKSCSNCHTMADDGGTSDVSFCSNSACHGIVYDYAGFDAPALRERLRQPTSPTTDTTTPLAPSGKVTWDSNVGPLFSSSCGSCHGSNPSAGLDLTSYATAMQGGNDGPVINPGDSAGSTLVVIQNGKHFGNLSPEELQTVKQWIDAGAPEK